MTIRLISSNRAVDSITTVIPELVSGKYCNAILWTTL